MLGKRILDKLRRGKFLGSLACLLALGLALGAAQTAQAHDDGGSKIDVTLAGTPAVPPSAALRLRPARVLLQVSALSRSFLQSSTFLTI